SLKILDPACGSGAFLNQALNFLIDEHNFIIDLETDLRKGQYFAFDIDTAVLENNLYGVDINEESVEIAKLSLWLKTTKKGRKLTDLSNHIKCGNSLIDDPEIAGDKAFDWNKEFPEIMQNGGFDVVIGNPPYVVVKGGRWVGGFQYDKKSITYLKNNFEASSQQINTYILFLELGLKLSRKGGLISQITPNTFLTNEYSQKLRTLLVKHSSIKEFFKSESAFEDASVETVITTYRNTKRSKQIINVKLLNYIDGYKLNLSEIINFTEDSKYLININKKSIPLLKKLSRIDKVSKYAKVWRGLTTGDDKKYLSLIEETNLHKPIISGSEVERYYLKRNKKFVYYVSELLDRPRDERIFLLNEKLISKFVGKKLTFCYDNHQHYVINTACSIELIDNKVNLYFLLTILNSKLTNFYFQQIFSDNRDTFPIMKSGNIESLPLMFISYNKQQPFIEKADIMLSLNKQKQEKVNKFLHRLETNFVIENFSNKMKAFYDFDFKTLISELKKKKVKLTFSQQDEFEEYFNNYKDEINELQKQIDKTDNEIDQMVYELYGLTKEEIEVVEGI
ncbi:MAG: Eco57I restriction-modification methylase domain-containing protein, partial [Candidatus Cloacimonetes bacterium]|nr:Eco57I restriction-modification methylase domain-containing protein [Candidatus Cloacimonadota bacterium]